MSFVCNGTRGKEMGEHHKYADFFICLYMYMYCLSRSSYQKRRIGIPITGLTPPHLCTCLKPGPIFPMSYVVVFFVFSWFI